MPVRKIRVEVYDESGNRYKITFEGRVTREKALQILDMVELLGGMPGVEPELPHQVEVSKIDKARFIVERNFPLDRFSAKDIQSFYEREVREPISLSTVSTYLSRLAERGLLLKTRNSNKVFYRLASGTIRKIIKNP